MVKRKEKRKEKKKAKVEHPLFGFTLQSPKSFDNIFKVHQFFISPRINTKSSHCKWHSRAKLAIWLKIVINNKFSQNIHKGMHAIMGSHKSIYCHD
jgi:hypothetical protein